MVSIIAVLLLITVLFINLSPECGKPPTKKDLKQYANSPQLNNNKFNNTIETAVKIKTDWSRVASYFTGCNKAPGWSMPVNQLEENFFNDKQDNATRLTWFGHSALMLEMSGKKIFIDPMLCDVLAPHPWLSAARFKDTLPMQIENLPEMDAVLISHDHYDHLDYGSIIVIKDKVKMFYVPLGIKSHLESWDVPSDHITELDWWQEIQIDDIKLIATPARHFSGRGLTDRNKTLWCSYIIQNEKDTIYFGGDSGYDTHFKEIGEKYGPFDLTMLECGQYDEQWPEMHMMPEETVLAAIDLESKLFMPIHWGNFKLSLQEWIEPVERAVLKAKELEVNVTTPLLGESVFLDKKIPQCKWWGEKNKAS
ncbi:MBL fold metallo-hydrolase [Nonlabens sp.]|uniref:MBL fold metallo-hydrolase n=2 Tax=Nonlabens sp. TaxID=1888209 RepID=UPI003266B519